MEKRIEIGLLYDFYGPLLTKRRADLVKMYCEEDLSLSEIADETGVTRQGVYDAIRNARSQLEEYERQLGLMSRYRRIEAEVQACRRHLSAVIPTPDSAHALSEAARALDRIERIQS